MKLFLVILLCVGCSSGVIYHLNDTEYERMPDLMQFDDYERCLREPAALYCTAWAALVSDTPSPLMDMIQEYSEHTPKHFNHSRIFRGLCMKQRCKEQMKDTKDLKDQMEACLNKTLFEEYRLKTKIDGDISCNNEDMVDSKDLVVAVVILVILMLNVVGTLYDVVYTTGKINDGTKYLNCFSIRRNFRKLISDSTEGTDPRLRRLKGLNGLRIISTAMVILAHSLGMSFYVENTHYVEKVYSRFLGHLLLNGPLIMQTYFMMSGLLLVYNSCLYLEKHECNWRLLIKGFVLRWARLTPTYALVLAFTATWMRHLGSGPLWNFLVKSESSDCREYWWWHMNYLNNYIDTSTCMIQSWYLAADTQLYCLGIIVFVFCQTKRRRVIVLFILFIIGAIIPTLQTYYQDLDAIMMVTPENINGFFIVDATFNHIYKRGHTNLLAYASSMALGYLIYHWKDTGVNLKQYKKYRPLLWLLSILMAAIMYSAVMFFGDYPRMSLFIRTSYAALIRPLFCSIIAICIWAMALRFDNIYRYTLEWDGWTVLSKVCYCAFLLHIGIVRYTIGSQEILGRTHFIHQVNSFLGVFILSFASAYPLWLLVQAPFDQLVKTAFSSKTTEVVLKKKKSN